MTFILTFSQVKDIFNVFSNKDIYKDNIV